MTPALLDRRILGAVRFLDAATGLPVSRPLRVSAPGVGWLRNRSGDYVIAGAPGLESHVFEFASPPPMPALGSVLVTVTVVDPSGEYLPRRATVALPRDPDPDNADQATSLFRPIDLPMYPAPAAAVAFGWAVIRATVLGQTPADRLPGALLRVVQQSDDAVLARGLADARGEALVAVPGIPVTTFNAGEGAVLASEVAARVEVFPSPQPAEPTDPDAAEAQAVLKSAPVQLASGRRLQVVV